MIPKIVESLFWTSGKSCNVLFHTFFTDATSTLATRGQYEKTSQVIPPIDRGKNLMVTFTKFS